MNVTTSAGRDLQPGPSPDIEREAANRTPKAGRRSGRYELILGADPEPGSPGGSAPRNHVSATPNSAFHLFTCGGES